MKKLKTFALKKPILFSLLLMTFALIFFYVPTEKLCLPFCDKQCAEFLGVLINKMVVSSILVIVLIKFDLVKSIGLTVFPNRWKDWFIAWPFIIITLINFLPLINSSLIIDTSKPVMVSLFTLMNFSIGLSEELLVRGVILGMLLLKWGNTKKGIYISVIVSSAIFGSGHICNLIANPSFLVATLSQIVYATSIGIFFAACVLRSKTIWPMIIFHAAFDFAGELQLIAVGGGIEVANQITASTNLREALISILLCSILAIYGFFILRKVTPTDIQCKFSKKINENCNTEIVHECL
jgi:membrane protease YdiL (CAAX protease family)